MWHAVFANLTSTSAVRLRISSNPWLYGRQADSRRDMRSSMPFNFALILSQISAKGNNFSNISIRHMLNLAVFSPSRISQGPCLGFVLFGHALPRMECPRVISPRLFHAAQDTDVVTRLVYVSLFHVESASSTASSTGLILMPVASALRTSSTHALRGVLMVASYSALDAKCLNTRPERR